jgi:hypothetical protein
MPGGKLCSSAVLAVAVVAGGLVAGAGSAAADGAAASPATAWHVTRAASASLRSASLGAESCPAADFCLAVGADISGDVDQWNGRAWRPVSLPTPPPGDQADPTGVACTSAADCVVVGYDSSLLTTLVSSFVWRYSGGGLHPAALPAPPGVESYLTAVSCADKESCMAVGGTLSVAVVGREQVAAQAARRLGLVGATPWSSRPGLPPTARDRLSMTALPGGSAAWQMTAYLWNGTSWQLDAPAGGYDQDPVGVSCRQGMGCLVPVDGLGARPRVEWWRPSGWKWVALPAPPATNVFAGGVAGIACPANGFCTIVGDTIEVANGLVITPVSYVWNGRDWTYVPMRQQARSQQTEPLAVHCASPTYCVAVAAAQSQRRVAPGLQASRFRPLSEVWNGRRWRRVQLSVPAGAQSSQLLAVRCVGADDCVAVGSYYGSSPVASLAFSERWNGHSWRLVPAPTPVTSVPTSLDGVDCLSSSTCAAVGSYASDVTVPVAESWNGTRWSLQTVPSAPYEGAPLLSVSCVSATTCQAAGDGGPLHTPELASLNGTRWSAAKLPGPTFWLSSEISSVSCSSSSLCFGVGEYAGFSSSGALIYRWDGTKWSSRGLPALPKGDTLVVLGGVSCTSKDSCVAVGAYTKAGSSNVLPLAAVWNGGAWRVEDLPTAEGYASVPASVDCTSATSCVAVGSYGKGSAQRPVAYVYNGSTWRLVTTPVAPSGLQDYLFSISCASTKYCLAIGSNQTSSWSVPTAYLEAWDGSSWSRVSLPTASALPSDVSCAATSCTAVGEDDAGPFAASLRVP